MTTTAQQVEISHWIANSESPEMFIIDAQDAVSMATTINSWLQSALADAQSGVSQELSAQGMASQTVTAIDVQSYVTILRTSHPSGQRFVMPCD